MVIVSTSHPQSLVYLLDAHLFKKLAVLSLDDVTKSITVLKQPLWQDFDILILAQSCGSMKTYKIGVGNVVVTEINTDILSVGTIFKTLSVF